MIVYSLVLSRVNIFSAVTTETTRGHRCLTKTFTKARDAGEFHLDFLPGVPGESHSAPQSFYRSWGYPGLWLVAPSNLRARCRLVEVPKRFPKSVPAPQARPFSPKSCNLCPGGGSRAFGRRPGSCRPASQSPQRGLSNSKPSETAWHPKTSRKCMKERVWGEM